MIEEWDWSVVFGEWDKVWSMKLVIVSINQSIDECFMQRMGSMRTDWTHAETMSDIHKTKTTKHAHSIDAIVTFVDWEMVSYLFSNWSTVEERRVWEEKKYISWFSSDHEINENKQQG